MLKKFALTFFIFFGLIVFTGKTVRADGTYANIGTSTSNNGSPDAVSWSQGYPIVVDSYGHFIVPTQRTGQTSYDLSYSNDAGTTWNVNTTVAIPARAAVAYDAINDTLLTLSADTTNGDVTFDRFLIRRDTDYTISDITHDDQISPLVIDEAGACASASAGNPILLIKNISGTNRVVAFWSIQKTNCPGDLTATRTSTLAITNSSTDGDAGSWQSTNGTASVGSNSDAVVNFNFLYTHSGTDPFYQQSAMIKSSGTHVNDIYYYNVDTNDTNVFMRLVYDNGLGLWTTATTPTTFGGDVNDAQGYNLKKELLSKPVEATGEDRVYVGISRWLDNTNGDTVSLFYADTSDAMNLAANVYSAGGAHCIYPTFDISYDQSANKVYTFYDISGASTVCGNVEYKTFSGSTLSTATPFYSIANRSVDIPIVYQNRLDDKMQLFFRLNNASTPGIPPHEIYYGYVALNNTQSPPSVSSNGVNNNEDVTYNDFNQICSVKDGVDIVGNSSLGSLQLARTFYDEFETPTNPYTLVFNDKWDIPSVWGSGFYNPKPNGSINVFNSAGAYVLSRSSFTARQQFTFTASFTQKNFLHIGLVDDAGFGKYAIFSTGNDGILKARVANGGSESNTVIGTSYYDGYHTYLLDWDVGTAKFYIDGVQVANLASNVPTGSMRIIMSNNDTTVGSSLQIDNVGSSDFAANPATYTSCPIDSGIDAAKWLTATYGETVGPNQTVTFQVRTSNDLNTWSGWTTPLSSGADIDRPFGRYAQYLVTFQLTAPSTSSPEVYDVNLAFVQPIPPTAVDDAKTTDFNTATTVNVLTNDTISSALDGSSPSITTPASHGTAVVTDLAGGIVTYTPTAGYSGTDTFQYQICDVDSLCDTATVTITINTAPVSAPEDSNGGNEGANGGVSGGLGNGNTGSCTETKPGKVIVNSAISLKPDEINVKFATPSGTITKYSIQISKLSQSYKDSENITADKTAKEYVFKNLNSNTTYFFRIRAENGCATGEWSTEFKTVTTSVKNDISTSGTVSAPVKTTDTPSGFKTEYLLIICCPLIIILLLVLANRKKDKKEVKVDYVERFR